MRTILIILTCLMLPIFGGCSNKKYTFTGSNIDKGTKTFWVNSFRNNAELVEPGIDRKFTVQLRELLENQTSLSSTDKNADLVYDGEITHYSVSPMTATADQKAAQNRLSITVNVRYTDKKHEDRNFEKPFSFFYDFNGDSLPSGSVLTAALEEIFERITQDIFNASLAKW